MNTPFHLMTDYQKNIVESFNNSAIITFRKSKMLSNVLDEVDTDYQLNMKLIYDWYYAKASGWTFGNKLGVDLTIQYLLVDKSTGIIYNDVTKTRFSPGDED